MDEFPAPARHRATERTGALPAELVPPTELEPPPRSASQAPTGGPRRPVDQRAVDLAQFLATAREQSLAMPISRRERALARRSEGTGRSGRTGSRGRMSWRVGVVALALVGVFVLLLAWSAQRTPTAAVPVARAFGPDVSTAPGTPAALPSAGAPSPAGARSPSGAPSPSAAAQVTARQPEAGRTSSAPKRTPDQPAVTVTEQVRVEPARPGAGAGSAVPATSWTAVVRQLLGARSAAFAAGRPEQLLDADAGRSPVLGSDRALLAAVVGPAGTGRVVGLSFDLSVVRVVNRGPRLVHLVVIGRQGPALVLQAGVRHRVPAGPVRTVEFELTRVPPARPGGAWGPWRLGRSWQPAS